jgi:hypothetical protein
MEGRVNSSGVLVADKIEIKSTGSIRIEGNVEQIDAATQRLTVLGVGFTVRSGANLEDHSSANVDPLTFADIAIGDRVQIRGFLDGTVVVASELERDDPSPTARLRGRVTGKNASASQVDILGVTVTGNSATQYQGAADQAAFFNAVKVGDFVEADWNTLTATNAPADQLSMEED